MSQATGTSIKSLGEVTFPVNVYKQLFAYKVTLSDIYITVAKENTVEPAKKAYRIPIDRSNGFSLDTPTEIRDFSGNVGLVFNLAVADGDTILDITGYGVVDDVCGSNAGLIMTSDLQKYKCLCDGSTNCNLTSNIGRCFYDVISKMIICDGADGSKNIWIISPDFSTVKRLTHQSAVERGRVSCLPYKDQSGNELLLCAVSGGASGVNFIKLFTVDIDDILSANDGADMSTLQSYSEVWSTTQYNSKARHVLHSNGKILVIPAVDANGNGYKIVFQYGNWTPAIVSDSNNGGDALGATANGIVFGVTSGATITIYEVTFGGLTNIGGFGPTDTQAGYDNAMARRLGGWTNSNGLNKAELFALADGSIVPFIKPDYSQNKLVVYDLLTGNPVAYRLAYTTHRLVIPLTVQGVSMVYAGDIQVSNDGTATASGRTGLNGACLFSSPSSA